jgi:hypothetical protein
MHYSDCRKTTDDFTTSLDYPVSSEFDWDIMTSRKALLDPCLVWLLNDPRIPPQRFSHTVLEISQYPEPEIDIRLASPASYYTSELDPDIRLTPL